MAGSLGSPVEGHDGKSGFYPLPDGLDALGARLALIDKAERSLDAQYFLAKPDDAGLLSPSKTAAMTCLRESFQRVDLNRVGVLPLESRTWNMRKHHHDVRA